MAKLLECIKELYGTSNLYEVLGVKSDASVANLKKAYYKISLQVHPDRVTEEEKQTATRKFQSLSQVFAILSNSDKRALYDESGEIDEEFGLVQENRNWDSYWRILFKKITIADIEEFESKYRFSEEETADLLTAYDECEGDMDMILERVPCCNEEDDMRFKEIINEKIKAGKVKMYDAFDSDDHKKQTKRRKKAKIEAEEAAEAAREVGLGNSDDDLTKMIMQRQQVRENEANNFFKHLEAKYSKPKAKASGGKGKKKQSKTARK